MAETSTSGWGTDAMAFFGGRSPKPRISVLVVADRPVPRQSVRDALWHEGVEVVTTVAEEDAASRVGVVEPDVVVIDLAGHPSAAQEVCRRIRRVSQVPVIVTSTVSETRAVVDTLDAGADDYLVKPVSVVELTARIRAVLRRVGAGRAPAVLRVGGLEIRMDEGVVLLEGRPVALTRTELRLLGELGANPGRVLSRQQLLERVWGHGYLGESRLIDTQVRRLRAKIEADPSRPRRIVTVRGLGYKLVAENPG
jgi:DNA-binding response OmpR family regulator